MGTPLLWIGFNLFVLASIALDLGVFNRRLHKVSLREAGFFSSLWVVLSILFGLGPLHLRNRQTPPAPHAGVGHPRRTGDARRNDSGGCGADSALFLGAVRFWRVHCVRRNSHAIRE